VVLTAKQQNQARPSLIAIGEQVTITWLVAETKILSVEEPATP
jgi:hypothetical protein